MKLRKAIAYAYPTSENAEILGKSATGAYYVEQSISVSCEGGSWSPPYIAPGTEGDSFDRADDPDLVSLFAEVEGDICPDSKRWHPEYYA